jgi:hypothetical protein
MVGVTSASFAILINGVGYLFFKSGKELKKGYPLSPHLFILVMEGLIWALIEAQRAHSFQVVNFGSLTRLTHLLFVEDVLIFCRCAIVEC